MSKKPYTFRFEEGVIEKLKKLAEKDKRPLTNYIELLFDKHIETTLPKQTKRK